MKGPMNCFSRLAIFCQLINFNGLNGCWLWIGRRHRRCQKTRGKTRGKLSYGIFDTYEKGDPKTPLAHRVAYKYFVGKIPEGLDVLHKCDIPECVNPAHLFTGTHKENMEDMARKGRTFKGWIPTALRKLTEEQVVEIRSKYIRGKITLKSLANDYGMSIAQIGRIVLKKNWKRISAT